MPLIDSNKFIIHLVWSGLIDGATCGQLKDAIELCKVVHCKDCEYLRVGGVGDGSHWYYCEQTDCDTEYDGYCFRAKVKSEEIT